MIRDVTKIVSVRGRLRSVAPSQTLEQGILFGLILGPGMSDRFVDQINDGFRLRNFVHEPFWGRHLATLCENPANR